MGSEHLSRLAIIDTNLAQEVEADSANIPRVFQEIKNANSYAQALNFSEVRLGIKEQAERLLPIISRIDQITMKVSMILENNSMHPTYKRAIADYNMAMDLRAGHMQQRLQRMRSRLGDI